MITPLILAIKTFNGGNDKWDLTPEVQSASRVTNLLSKSIPSCMVPGSSLPAVSGSINNNKPAKTDNAPNTMSGKLLPILPPTKRSCKNQIEAMNCPVAQTLGRQTCSRHVMLCAFSGLSILHDAIALSDVGIKNKG